VGYDFIVLKQVDFDRYRPRLLICEHEHLGREDEAACRSMLEGCGYETLQEGRDTWCLDLRDVQRRDWPLVDLWRQLGSYRDRAGTMPATDP